MILTKILTIVILIIAQITAFIAGQARFYAMCLNIGLARGYLYLFSPAIAGILTVLILPKLGLESLYDEILSLVAIASQLGLLLSVYRLTMGTCSKSIEPVEVEA